MNNTHDTTCTELTKEDAEAYADEHRRLESIIQDSEKIWEDRTFQIAAGGLTLTFTVFSFLISKHTGRRIRLADNSDMDYLCTLHLSELCFTSLCSWHGSKDAVLTR